SFNRYAYVNNDPVNFVDPSGLNLAFTDCHLVLDAGDGGFHFGIFYEHWVCTTENIDTGRRGPPDIGLGGGSDPQKPVNNPKKSYAARVAACCARCLNAT